MRDDVRERALELAGRMEALAAPYLEAARALREGTVKEADETLVRGGARRAAAGARDGAYWRRLQETDAVPRAVRGLLLIEFFDEQDLRGCQGWEQLRAEALEGRMRGTLEDDFEAAVRRVRQARAAAVPVVPGDDAGVPVRAPGLGEGAGPEGAVAPARAVTGAA